MLPGYILKLMGIAFKMYDSTTGNGELSGEVLKSVITVAGEEGHNLIYLLYALLYRILKFLI